MPQVTFPPAAMWIHSGLVAAPAGPLPNTASREMPRMVPRQAVNHAGSQSCPLVVIRDGDLTG